MTKLAVSVVKYLEGERSVACGRIVPADGVEREVRIPVAAIPEPLWLDVKPGPCLIRATLPSGRVLSKSVVIGELDTNVSLDASGAAHEWLSWSHFAAGAGAVGSIPEQHGFFAADEFPRLVEKRHITLQVGKDATPVGPAGVRATLGGIGWTIQPRADGPYLVLSITTEDVEGNSRRWPRVSISTAEADGRRAILSVPAPWPDLEDEIRDRQIDVLLVDTDQLASDAERRSTRQASVVVRDPVFGALFGYWASGDPTSALKIGRPVFDRARDILSRKRSNPYAAAAAGYLLVDTPAAAAAEADWLRQLANGFDWLPDGAILYGWHLLQREEEGLARSMLVKAASRGMPLFTAGVRLLVAGLSRLGGERQDKQLDDATRRARGFGRVIDPNQPFTTVTTETP